MAPFYRLRFKLQKAATCSSQAYHFQHAAFALKHLFVVHARHAATSHAHLLPVHLRLVDGLLPEPQCEYAPQPKQQKDVVG